MPFTSYIPQSPLSAYIECFWSEIGHTHYTREKVLPTGSIDLMFNLGSPHKVVDKTNFSRYQLHKESWVCGLQTEYIVIEAVAETEMVGIRFRPGGAHPFFPVPLHELRNRVVDLELVWGAQARSVRERLWEAPTLLDKFQLLERVLQEQLASALHAMLPIQHAVQMIRDADKFSTVRQLSEQLGMSQKHLIQQFNGQVGVTPKMLHRIIKFNRTLCSIGAAQPVNWAALAHACGYYDQAHFNKDFSAFSGLNPSSYLQLRNEWFRNDELTPESVHFVPIE